MKLFDVSFEYTERARITNIVANSADEAVVGAQLISKDKIKEARDFVATEVVAEPTTSPTTQTIQ